METIKKGSTGETVKVLQKKINVYPDGIFGQTTESVLKQYQKTHGLTADGVCGDKTWASLGIVSSKCIDSSVVYDPLNVHITKCANRPIKYLVIHYTAGSRSTAGCAKNCKTTFEKASASADFAVDDTTMVQFNPDIANYYCWAVGGNSYGNKGGSLYGKAVNKNCISIEICSTCTPATSQAVRTDNHKGWSFTDAALDNARRLARLIMAKYNIDRAHVIRHYDVTGKLCPAVFGWNDEPLKNIDGTKTGEQNNSKIWEAWKNSL